MLVYLQVSVVLTAKKNKQQKKTTKQQNQKTKQKNQQTNNHGLAQEVLMERTLTMYLSVTSFCFCLQFRSLLLLVSWIIIPFTCYQILRCYANSTSCNLLHSFVLWRDTLELELLLPCLRKKAEPFLQL